MPQLQRMDMDMSRYGIGNLEPKETELTKLRTTLAKIETIRAELKNDPKILLENYYNSEGNAQATITLINQKYGEGFAYYSKSEYPDEHQNYRHFVNLTNQADLEKMIATKESEGIVRPIQNEQGKAA